MIKKIIILFLVWRALLFIPVIVGEKTLAYRKNYPYTSPRYFNQINQPILAAWGNFDGVYYIRIAAEGYTPDTAGFFPMFPLIIRAIWPNFVVALFVANFSSLLALIVFYKILRLDFSEKTSFLTVVFLLLFPTSFFLGSVYSESLFLLFVLTSFYLVRQHHLLNSALVAMFAAATRLVGFAMLPALALEKIGWRLIFVPLGIVSFALYSWLNWGNPLALIQMHGQLYNNRSVDALVFPLQTAYRYIKILVTISPGIYEWWVALFEISFTIFAAALLYFAWKKGVRKSYLVFSVISFLVPALTGTFSGMPRYVLVLFPMFIALALTKNRLLQLLYGIAGGILLFIFTLLFSRGYFIA